MLLLLPLQVGVDLVKSFSERGYTVWFTYNSGRQRADALIESLPQDSNAQARLVASVVSGSQGRA